jgi:hypothetical protein
MTQYALIVSNDEWLYAILGYMRGEDQSFGITATLIISPHRDLENEL